MRSVNSGETSNSGAARLPPLDADALEDLRLLARIEAGDDRACDILVRRHLRAATLFAAQLLGDRDDAEDVVQSALVLAVQRSATFGVHRPFAPWLFAVVRRLALKRHERRSRRVLLWRRWGDNDPQAAAPAEQSELASDVALVRCEMASLPAMQRVCFELVILRDLSVEDVATMYEIAPSTVRQHVFRARRELRPRLAALLGPRGDRWSDSDRRRTGQ